MPAFSKVPMLEPRAPFRPTQATQTRFSSWPSLPQSQPFCPLQLRLCVHYLYFGGHRFDWVTDHLSLSASSGNCSALRNAFGWHSHPYSLSLDLFFPPLSASSVEVQVSHARCPPGDSVVRDIRQAALAGVWGCR